MTETLKQAAAIIPEDYKEKEPRLDSLIPHIQELTR